MESWETESALAKLVSALPVGHPARKEFVTHQIAIEKVEQLRDQRNTAIRYWKQTLHDLKRAIEQRDELLGKR